MFSPPNDIDIPPTWEESAGNTSPQEHQSHNQGAHSSDRLNGVSNSPYIDISFGAYVYVGADLPFSEENLQTPSTNNEEHDQFNHLTFEPTAILSSFTHPDTDPQDREHRDIFFHPPQAPITEDVSQRNRQLNNYGPQISHPTSTPGVPSPIDSGIASPVTYSCGNHCDGKFFGPHTCFNDGNQLSIFCSCGCSYCASYISFSRVEFNRHYWYCHCAEQARASQLWDCLFRQCERFGENGTRRKDNFRNHLRRHSADFTGGLDPEQLESLLNRDTIWQLVRQG